jgi:hypothetical protein
MKLEQGGDLAGAFLQELDFLEGLMGRFTDAAVAILKRLLKKRNRRPSQSTHSA